LIVPIHKGASKPKHNPDNYRPITLLQSMCKLFEKIIYTRIQEWLRSTHVNMLNIVTNYARTWRFALNPDKCNVVVCGDTSGKHPSPDWRIGMHSILQCDVYTHLGVAVASNLKSSKCVQRACGKGRKAFFSLLGYGVKPLGLNSIHSVSLYKKIVLPSVLYGCELWNNLSSCDISYLEKCQQFCCKKILGLHNQTRSDMCESIVGLFRIPAEIDRRKLMFLYKLCTLSGTCLAKKVFLRRLYSYLYRDALSNAQQGFIPDVCNLLSAYGLTHILEQFIHSGVCMSKLSWKRCVKHAIRAKETRMWRLRMSTDTNFCRFRYIHTQIETAVILKAPNTTFECKLIDHSVRLLTCVPQTVMQTCPHCAAEFDDVARHILTSCTRTMSSYYHTVSIA
jgi:hypothetical protein